MAIEFEAKNVPIILKASGEIAQKVMFVRNLYDKAQEKISHFDRLRQQVLNVAVIVFSGVLAFVMKTDDIFVKCASCAAVPIVMLLFWYRDHRYHRSTHGFAASMYIFTQVIAHLIENPKDDVSFLQYHAAGETSVRRFSVHGLIYAVLSVSALLLGGIICWKAG